MKLYATTTSERATKGQGGQYIDFELQNKDRLVCLQLHFEENGRFITPALQGCTPQLLRALCGEFMKAVKELDEETKVFFGSEPTKEDIEREIEDNQKGKKKTGELTLHDLRQRVNPADRHKW